MNKEIMLYIHIPFCVRKCAYCDFLSFASGEEEREGYLQVLRSELRSRSEMYKDREVSSIFVGGGTPSLLSGEQMEVLLTEVRQRFCVKENAEITVECNPGTLTKEKAAAYQRAGMNRMSFGLQSANDEELKALGRIHTYEEFLTSFHLAREAGFRNINVDLMEGLPGQNTARFLDTLQKVMALQPEHISMYGLIIEPGTPFYALYGEAGEKVEDLPSEECEREIYDKARTCMKEKGYLQYEISNFAKDGYACKHNLGYWERKEYLGLGLGASSLIDNCRLKNTEDIKTYLSGKFDYIEMQQLSVEDQMEEYMFLGLRKTKGVSIPLFEKLFHKRMQEIYGDWIQKMLGEELLREEDDYIFLTNKGMDVANYVMQGFLLGD